MDLFHIYFLHSFVKFVFIKDPHVGRLLVFRSVFVNLSSTGNASSTSVVGHYTYFSFNKFSLAGPVCLVLGMYI